MASRINYDRGSGGTRRRVAAQKAADGISANMRSLQNDPARRLQFAVMHARQRAAVLRDLERRRQQR